MQSALAIQHGLCLRLATAKVRPMRGISFSVLTVLAALGCSRPSSAPRQPLAGPSSAAAPGGHSTTPARDQSQPEYWIERLVDPNQQALAVQKLTEAFDATMARSSGDLAAPEPRALIDRIVVSLTDGYVRNFYVMDRGARVGLVKLLNQFRDGRAEPAFKKAMTDFAERVPTAGDELDLNWAARAVRELKLTSCADALLQAFLRVQASTLLGNRLYRDVRDALIRMPQPSWSDALRRVLDAPIEIPKGAHDHDKIDPYKNQLYWQTTAAQVLGLLRDSSAVEPLLRVMLDPAKADVQATAVLALIKIGQPAADRAAKLLRSDDAALQRFHVERSTSYSQQTKPQDLAESHMRLAALVLGSIGLAESAAPLITALERSKNDVTRGVLARELTKLPRSSASIDAFKQTFERLPPRTRLSPVVIALELLAECATTFHDPSLVPWLVEQHARIAGSYKEAVEIRAAIRLSMLKLATPQQLTQVRRVYQQHDTTEERQRLASVEPLLAECRAQVDCYLAALSKSSNQTEERQFVAMKAALMVGLLGTESDSERLIERVKPIKNAAVRFVVAQSVDHLLPRGSVATAEHLATLIEANEQTNDRALIASDMPLKQVLYRIRTRTQPVPAMLISSP